MKNHRELITDQTATIIKLDDCRKNGSGGRGSSRRVAVMVEIASEDTIGNDIKMCLTRDLQKSGRVTVSDDHPDWVFSIIAFQQYNLVELSVVIRQFFRSTAPGTEMTINDSSGQEVRRKGGWSYESLKRNYSLDKELKNCYSMLRNEGKGVAKNGSSATHSTYRRRSPRFY